MSGGLFRLLSRGVLAVSMMLTSCELFSPQTDGRGELRIAFGSVSDPYTRSSEEVPDTSDFMLNVTDSKGKLIFSGKYGDCPETLPVEAGSYVIRALSCEFEVPAFSAPQYGDEQCVIVPDGGVADVRLTCTQQNSGVRLRIDSSFLTGCPDGVLFLSSEEGKLMYGYSERRVAYFSPGKVSLILSQGGTDRTLMSRTLLAQEVLSLGVSMASVSSSGGQSAGRISVSVDTLRNWISDEYVIGGSNAGSEFSDALTVAQAMQSVGDEDVWVGGYIVGGDLTSSSASFAAPFSSRTNLLIGPKSATADRNACMSVQLPSGEFREALNLVDNQDVLGKKVYLRGDVVESYYGLPGIKNLSEYVFP